MHGPGSAARTRVLALGLFASAAALFAPAVGHDFILLDDRTYIVENPHLAGGFTAEALRWALAGGYAANWHPLTWLSHLLDASLFGLDPRGHHVGNVVLHGLATAALFLALRRMSGRFWPSALAAALFGVHPLRVESVAWASSRKDALAGLFWVLAMGAHAWRARRPGAGGRALAVAALGACAMMSKPTAVTLPVALLLLDWWPLGRLRAAAGAGPSRVRALVVEKSPLLVFAAAAAALTWRAQLLAGAMDPLAHVGLADRAANAAVAAVAYLQRLAWPSGLAILYPHEVPGPATALGAAAALGALSLLVLALRRRLPWLAAGWAWYLVTLLPAAGLVQVGVQGAADRYTHLPSIGVAIALSWSAARAASRRRLVVPVAAAAVAALALLGAATRAQLAHWRDDVAVFTRAVDVTRGNWLAELNLGAALGARGDHAGALERFEEALRIRPGYPLAMENARRARAALGGGPSPAEARGPD